MDEQLRRDSWIPWAVASVVLLAVAALAYVIGFQAGADGGETTRQAWRGPLFGPLFFLVFVWMVASGWWWGLRWRCPPWYYRGYYRPPPGWRPEWEEWHREAHRREGSGSGPDQVREPRQP